MAVSRRNNGFVLITASIAITVLLGFAALGVDVARMYVIKSELQAFTDSAALSAAMQIDDSAAGFDRARRAAESLATGPHAMKWDMGTKPIGAITASFARGGESPEVATWSTQPKEPTGYRFVRVVATAPAPLVFLRIFQSREASTVAASAMAVKTPDGVRLVE